MKQAMMRESFVEKLSSLRKKVEMRFPEMDMQELLSMIGKVGHYHYNKKECLIFGKEKQLYDFLIENSYNPFTIYRWLLLERIPEDIRFQLKQRRVSQKKAISEAFKRRHETMHELGESIRNAGLALIRGM